MKKIILKPWVLIFIFSSITSLLANSAFSAQQEHTSLGESFMNYIVIQYAKYYSERGLGFVTKFCDPTNQLKSICDNANSCSIVSNNAICGDPEPHVSSALLVKYKCGTRTKIASAREFQKVILDCSIE